MNPLGRRTLTAALVIAAGTAPVRPGWAEFQRRDAGTSGAQFLKLGADARAAGMGNAGRAVCEDANAAYWNPAGLAGLRHRHATATHGALYQSAFYDFLAYAHPIESILGRSRRRRLRDEGLGAVALAALYLNAGALDEIDNTGQETGGSFTPQDLAAIIAWGGSLTRDIDVGVGLKLVTEQIHERAATGAADFGLRLHSRLGSLPYIASLSAHNVGGRLKFLEQSDPLPLQVAFSQSLRVAPGWFLAADIVGARDRGVYPAFGTEIRLPVAANLSAAMRGGWDGRTGSDLETVSGLSLGGGFSFQRLSLDYAWTPFGLLGVAHRLSVSCRF